MALTPGLPEFASGPSLWLQSLLKIGTGILTTEVPEFTVGQTLTPAPSWFTKYTIWPWVWLCLLALLLACGCLWSCFHLDKARSPQLPNKSQPKLHQSPQLNFLQTFLCENSHNTKQPKQNRMKLKGKTKYYYSDKVTQQWNDSSGHTAISTDQSLTGPSQRRFLFQ